jgi:hypothetical protein
MAKPLTNRKRDGSLYCRPAEINGAIDQALLLARADVLAGLACRSATDPDYIPSEVLVHLLRETRTDNDLGYFNILYRELLRRIGRALPQSNTYSVEGKAATDERLEQVREAVLQRFEDAVVEDRYRPGKELDIFECRFNYTVEKMREKAWERHYREAARRHPKTVEMLEISIDSGDREFASLRDRFFADPTSRILLYAEIDSLPHPDRRILQMLVAGFPIESTKPGMKSITGDVGCDCKTIWNRRDAFVERMRTKLDGGEGR